LNLLYTPFKFKTNYHLNIYATYIP